MLHTMKRGRRVRSMLGNLQGHDGHDVRLLREIGLPILREALERALAQQAVLIVTDHTISTLPRSSCHYTPQQPIPVRQREFIEALR